eukprot:11497300-Alexandrium_andersonii.AAC.1
MTRFTVDPEFSIGALCRCLRGRGGQGRDCWGCSGQWKDPTGRSNRALAAGPPHAQFRPAA